MDNFLAVGIAEGFIEPEHEDQVTEAWQHLHDTGLAYRLQGSFGREAQRLLAEGVIHDTPEPTPVDAAVEEIRWHNAQRENAENLARELGPGALDQLPPGYKILCDGIIDPYYAIKDDDMGTIVGGTHAFRRDAIADAWRHHYGQPQKYPFEHP